MTVVYYVDPPSYKYGYKTNYSKTYKYEYLYEYKYIWTVPGNNCGALCGSAKVARWLGLLEATAVEIGSPWLDTTAHHCCTNINISTYTNTSITIHTNTNTHIYRYNYTCMYKYDCKNKYKDGRNDRQNCITVIWQNWSTVSIPEKARLSQWKWLLSGFWPPWYFIPAAYFGFWPPN